MFGACGYLEVGRKLLIDEVPQFYERQILVNLRNMCGLPSSLSTMRRHLAVGMSIEL